MAGLKGQGVGNDVLGQDRGQAVGRRYIDDRLSKLGGIRWAWSF
jgi:hypothetical protein